MYPTRRKDKFVRLRKKTDIGDNLSNDTLEPHVVRKLISDTSQKW